MPVSKTDWLSAAPVYPTNAKAGKPLFSFLNRLVRGEDLTLDEAAAFYRAVTSDNPDGPQLSAAIAALTAKGVTADELAGMAQAARASADPVKGLDVRTVDISVTGSPHASIFSVSAAAAIVAAGAGLPVTSQCRLTVGGVDVLKELNIKPAADPAGARVSDSGTGACMFDAWKFQQKLETVMKMCARLGLMTCFDFLPLLAHPAPISRQFVGVWHRSMADPVAEALARLGIERAWVVNGSDGFDGITLNGETAVSIVQNGKVLTRSISPANFGVPPASIDDLKADTGKQSASIIREVLASRRRDAARQLVVVNAAAALVIGGIAKDPMHGARLAEQSIDSGQAQNKLERLVQVTAKI